MSALQWQRCIEQIALTSTGDTKRILGLTSAMPDAGVSLVGHHLARTIAASDLKTLRVDLKQSSSRAVSEGTWIPGHDKARQFVLPTTDGYDLLCLGPSNGKQNLNCNVPVLREVFATDLSHYARIVIEMPPLLGAIDAGMNPLAVAGICDQLLLICAVGRDRKSDVSEAIALLRTVGVKLSGIITNEHVVAAPNQGVRRLTRILRRRGLVAFANIRSKIRQITAKQI